MRGKTSPAEPCLTSPQGLLPPGASRTDPLLGPYLEGGAGNRMWPQTRPSKWRDKGNIDLQQNICDLSTPFGGPGALINQTNDGISGPRRQELRQRVLIS